MGRKKNKNKSKEEASPEPKDKDEVEDSADKKETVDSPPEENK